MTKGLDSKILYTLLLVSGFVLTIGAASAVVLYSENIELDNGTGDSSIKVTSSTGDSKLILEDQGKRTWSLKTDDGTKKFQIIDETVNKPRITINNNAQIGIGTANPGAKLHVIGTFKTSSNAHIVGNLNVGGVITGSYIATLEATILDLQTRLAALEGAVPNISVNAGDISNNAGDISNNAAMLQAHDAAITSLEEGNPPQSNPCDPNGDGGYTAQEMSDYIISNGGDPNLFTLQNVSNMIINSEQTAGSPSNAILDSDAEINQFNGDILIPFGISSCPSI